MTRAERHEDSGNTERPGEPHWRSQSLMALNAQPASSQGVAIWEAADPQVDGDVEERVGAVEQTGTAAG